MTVAMSYTGSVTRGDLAPRLVKHAEVYIEGSLILRELNGGRTREVEDLKELFEERCTILEHDAGLPRAEADLEAARIMSTYARNRGYLWASLRAALSGYPSLMDLVPDRPGKVGGLPLEVAAAHVRKDGRVLKQGEFAGAMEVRI